MSTRERAINYGWLAWVTAIVAAAVATDGRRTATMIALVVSVAFGLRAAVLFRRL